KGCGAEPYKRLGLIKSTAGRGEIVEHPAIKLDGSSNLPGPQQDHRAAVRSVREADAVLRLGQADDFFDARDVAAERSALGNEARQRHIVTRLAPPSRHR